jgi:hypothetical protein
MDAAGRLELDGCKVFLLNPNLTVRHIIRICQQTGPHNIQTLPEDLTSHTATEMPAVRAEH